MCKKWIIKSSKHIYTRVSRRRAADRTRWRVKSKRVVGTSGEGSHCGKDDQEENSSVRGCCELFFTLNNLAFFIPLLLSITEQQSKKKVTCGELLRLLREMFNNNGLRHDFNKFYNFFLLSSLPISSHSLRPALCSCQQPNSINHIDGLRGRRSWRDFSTVWSFFFCAHYWLALQGGQQHFFFVFDSVFLFSFECRRGGDLICANWLLVSWIDKQSSLFLLCCFDSEYKCDFLVAVLFMKSRGFLIDHLELSYLTKVNHNAKNKNTTVIFQQLGKLSDSTRTKWNENESSSTDRLRFGSGCYRAAPPHHLADLETEKTQTQHRLPPIGSMQRLRPDTKQKNRKKKNWKLNGAALDYCVDCFHSF